MNKKDHKEKLQVNNTNASSDNSSSLNPSSGNLKSEGITLESNTSQDSFDRIQYVEGIVSKQLDLYTWCEEKVSTLATINAIMLTAATFFVEYTKNKISSPNGTISPTAHMNSNFHLIMLSVLVLPIFISLGITLWHVIPKITSHAIPKNVHIHRSVNGIHSFKSFEEYKKHLINLNSDEIYSDIVRQIYGMNKNIWKNQLAIKWAVRFDLIGLVGFILIIIYNFILM